jgi:O-antigen/teichoic acid export membrane protein
MKRHEIDLVSLIAGGVFLLVAVTHLVGAAAGDDPDLAWLLPVLLVGLGLAGLAGALRGVRGPRAATDDSSERPG